MRTLPRLCSELCGSPSPGSDIFGHGTNVSVGRVDTITIHAGLIFVRDIALVAVDERMNHSVAEILLLFRQLA